VLDQVVEDPDEVLFRMDVVGEPLVRRHELMFLLRDHTPFGYMILASIYT